MESRELTVVQAKRLHGVQMWKFCGGSILQMKTLENPEVFLPLTRCWNASVAETTATCRLLQVVHRVLERLGMAVPVTWQ